MGMFDNLNKAVADTFTEDIVMIDVDELEASADNIFDVNGIEEFAETILGQGGVKENLIVREKEDGKYEIISGHRRTEAVKYLLEKEETISRYLPCLVQDYADEDEKKLNIVLMNVSTRIISDSEMFKAFNTVNEILQNKKTLGEKFGKIRDKLAEILNTSRTQVSRIENIAHNAIEEVKDAVENGEISISTANFIAQLDEKEQENLLDENNISEIKSSEVKEILKNKKGARAGTFSKNKKEKNNEKADNDEGNDVFVENPTFFPEQKNNFELENQMTLTDNDDETENFENVEETENIENDNDVIAFASEPKNEERPENNKVISLNIRIKERNVELLKDKKSTFKTLVDTYIEMTDDAEEILVLKTLQDIVNDFEEQELEKIRQGYAK
jgi:ParB family chromosome partitioning protein